MSGKSKKHMKLSLKSCGKGNPRCTVLPGEGIVFFHLITKTEELEVWNFVRS